METIFIKGQFRNSRILVGESLSNLSEHIPGGQVFIITDKHVNDVYKGAFPDAPVYVLTPGEQRKTTASAVKICQWLIEKGAGRDAFLVGIGGGMVCDLTGFVASVYMRGINFGFVATSLLAQVDAALGGKNGVNLDGYKNIIGTFNHPHFVLCDTSMMESLPETEIKNGLAEAVKHTLIADRHMFNTLKKETKAALDLDESLINKLVKHSVQVKSDIVSKDEVEQGERRKLNLGHTWGHAVEKVDGIAHGHAVSIGMAFTASISEYKGLLKPEDRQRVLALLQSLGLPTETDTDVKTIFHALLKDKKKEEDHIYFVFMEGIGNVSIELIPLAELEEFVFSGKL